MEKLLILTDWFEPAYKAGGPIRSCVNLARGLKKHYQVFVLTGDRDFGDAAPFEGVQTNKWQHFEEGIQVKYLSPDQQKVKRLKKIFQDLEADYVYLNSMFSVRFTLIPLWLLTRSKLRTKIYLAPRGMLHAGALKYKSTKKKVFLKLFSFLGLAKSIHWHATDEQERKDIQFYFRNLKGTTVIPNLPQPVPQQIEIPAKSKNELSLVFISRISPKKNLEYLLQALHQVKSSVHLDIAGPIEDKNYWKSCKKLIQTLPAHVQSKYLGSLNRGEVEQVLKKNHIFALPTHGENFGHSIFEALAVGKPVVISRLTPWQNLEDSKAGFTVSLDDPKELAEYLDFFAVLDNNSYRSWAEGAWSYARNFSEQSDLLNQYHQMFN